MSAFLALLLAQAAVSPAAPPPSTTTAPATDPARLAAAERLLTAMRIERQYGSMFGNMIPLMSAQTFDTLASSTKVPVAVREKLADPATLAQARTHFADAATRAFRAQFGEMRAATAREYAAVFTAAELAAMTAFYDSPVGQKSLDLMPTIQKRLMPIGAAAGYKAGVTAMRETVEDLDLDPKKDDRS